MRYNSALINAAAFLALIGQASAATPDSWSCRNIEMEISCTGGVCVKSEEHTPMSIFLSDTEITVCAYSGCWEGAPADVSKTNQFETYIGNRLAWSHQPSDTANIAVTVDAKSGTATIIVADMYAQPATCTRDPLS